MTPIEGMAMFGDFNNKKNKKLAKEILAKKAAKQQYASSWTLPQPEVIGRGKKKDYSS